MAEVIREAPSPNHGSREGHAVTLIVLHSDASATLDQTIAWLADPASKVSYHYSVGRTGAVFRHVPEARRAWHAGVSAWAGENDGRRSVNSFSLGVNLSNRQDGGEPIPEAQWDAAVELVRALCQRYHIPAERIITHAQCALPPGRKRDPYPAEPTFDLDVFRTAVEAVL